MRVLRDQRFPKLRRTGWDGCEEKCWGPVNKRSVRQLTMKVQAGLKAKVPQA